MMEPIPLNVANSFVESYATFMDNKGWCQTRWKDKNYLTYELDTEIVRKTGDVVARFRAYYTGRHSDNIVTSIANLSNVSAVFTKRNVDEGTG